MRCPKCRNTENLQAITETTSAGRDFSATRRDFSATKGCCGSMLLGPLGILCGACGKGKQISSTTYWLCPRCGAKFKA